MHIILVVAPMVLDLFQIFAEEGACSARRAGRRAWGRQQLQAGTVGHVQEAVGDALRGRSSPGRTSRSETGADTAMLRLAAGRLPGP